MNITLIVGEYARVADGKLDVIGAGWTITGPGPVTMGIGILAEVPWSEMGTPHSIELLLVDEKGVAVPGPGGDPLFKVDATLVAEKPPGVLLGAPNISCMGLNAVGVPIPPGRRYRLIATVDGSPHLGAEWSFNTRPAQPQQLAG